MSHFIEKDRHLHSGFFIFVITFFISISYDSKVFWKITIVIPTIIGKAIYTNIFVIMVSILVALNEILIYFLVYLFFYIQQSNYIFLNYSKMMILRFVHNFSLTFSFFSYNSRIHSYRKSILLFLCLSISVNLVSFFSTRLLVMERFGYWILRKEVYSTF